MLYKILVSAILCLIFSAIAIAGYKDDPEKGWNWYKDPALEKPKKIKQPEPQKTIDEEKPTEEAKEKASVEEPVYNTSVDNFKFPLTEEAKSVPVLRKWLEEPTRENAKEWLAWQAKYFKHNEKISRSLRNAYLQYGDQVYKLEGMPEQPLAQILASQKKKEVYQDAFNKASKDVALLFFYKAGCEYCEAEQKPLELFVNKYGFTIRGVAYSKEDVLPDLPFKTRVAPKLFYDYQITSVPTIAAFNNKNKEIQVIAKGYTPTSQIELNLKAFLLNQNIISEEEFLRIWRAKDTEVLKEMLKKQKNPQARNNLLGALND